MTLIIMAKAVIGFTIDSIIGELVAMYAIIILLLPVQIYLAMRLRCLVTANIC